MDRKILLLAVSLGFLLSACGKEESSDVSALTSGSFNPAGCPSAKLSTSWSPQLTGAGSSNRDSSASVTKTTINATGPLTGLAQAAPASREIQVTIDMTEDLGANGSLSLIAKVTGFPADLTGSAYPVLVYLSDGTNDYINLARSGVSGDCSTSGYYTCSSTSCTANDGCSVSWPSAYVDRTHWEQHQITNQNSSISSTDIFPSVNTFPTCNSTGGTTPPSTSPSCAFNTTFFPTSPTPQRLRYGVTYTAKYVLLASNYTTLNNYTAGLEVTVVKKKDPTAAVSGALDLNVILVGTNNIDASKTAQGQRNLNTMIQAVHDYYNQSTVNVKLGAVNVYEWDCGTAGDVYADVELSDLGKLFYYGSSMLPDASTNQGVNLFFVSTIPDSSAGNNLTILGLSGGIGGPAMHGTSISGVAVSSFSKLGQYNPNCTSSPCALNVQEADFVDMAVTVTHEMGHYLGLNHPSESTGAEHDIVDDTPICTRKDSLTGYRYITHNSCLNLDSNALSSTGYTCSQVCTGYNSSTGSFCPDKQECQFNHVMWWTSKKFKEGTSNGDGNLFSTSSGRIINYYPWAL